MKVLVIGSGGREHALAWRLSQSASVDTVYIAPGNPGTASCGENVNIEVDAIDDLLAFAKDKEVDLTVVGPELPLSMGIVDVFKDEGLVIFGPSKNAARLEASKAFSKEILEAAGVSTPKAVLCTSKVELETLISSSILPIVLKADGLAGGKGVFVCLSKADIQNALQTLFENTDRRDVLFEEYISGPEVSFIAAVSGKTVIPFATSHDYKRALDSDKGLNTGGMGAVTPTPRLEESRVQEIVSSVFQKTLNELEKRNIHYCGFLYAGLMLRNDKDISVIEFNVRFGDPECQPIMLRFEGDLGNFLYSLATASTPTELPKWRKETAVCLTLAAEGYPSKPVLGDEIDGIEFAESLSGVKVFHAGTTLSPAKKLLSAGGRVLSVVALGSDVTSARALAYKAADMIQFRGRQLRRDIGLL